MQTFKRTLAVLAAGLAAVAMSVAIAAEEQGTPAVIKEGKNAVVRQAPALDAPMLFQLTPGTKVLRTAKNENGFSLIRTEAGKEGWTSKINLGPAPAGTPAPAPAAAAPQAPKMPAAPAPAPQQESHAAGTKPAVPPAPVQNVEPPIPSASAAGPAPEPSTATPAPVAAPEPAAPHATAQPGYMLIAISVVVSVLVGMLAGMAIERRRIKAAYNLFERIEG